jgi:uncharacterized protein (TIGR02594 family)
MTGLQLAADGTITKNYTDAGSYLYEDANGNNPVLDNISHESGRFKKLATVWVKEYFVSDHLGNTRVTFKVSPSLDIVENKHYYAFGLTIEGLSNAAGPDDNNRLTYNGKEIDKDLNWYHYGARFYDPTVGRWWVTDALDEYYSTYIYVGNNPVNLIDPDGNGSDAYEADTWFWENYTAARNHINEMMGGEYSGMTATRGGGGGSSNYYAWQYETARLKAGLPPDPNYGNGSYGNNGSTIGNGVGKQPTGIIGRSKRTGPSTLGIYTFKPKTQANAGWCAPFSINIGPNGITRNDGSRNSNTISNANSPIITNIIGVEGNTIGWNVTYPDENPIVLEVSAVPYADTAPWMTMATSQLGETEIYGPIDNSQIVEYHSTSYLHFDNDEAAWCSSFANWNMREIGIIGTEGAENALAKSWINWGNKITEPVYGAIGVVITGNSYHVGFVAGQNPYGNIILLGGNQGNVDQVKYSPFKRSDYVYFGYPTGFNKWNYLPLRKGDK